MRHVGASHCALITECDTIGHASLVLSEPCVLDHASDATHKAMQAVVRGTGSFVDDSSARTGYCKFESRLALRSTEIQPDVSARSVP
jgi:hypothetical protein